MSISYKKINSMIAKAVAQTDDLSEGSKQILKEICEKIYMLESSIERVSNQQTIADIKGEIVRRADTFLE